MLSLTEKFLGHYSPTVLMFIAIVDIARASDFEVKMIDMEARLYLGSVVETPTEIDPQLMPTTRN